LPLKRQLSYNMRVRQLLSINTSKTQITKDNSQHFSEDLHYISALTSSKRVAYTLGNLVYVIAKPLAALGISDPTALIEENGSSIVTGSSLAVITGQNATRNTSLP
jgi:hypothetical protein